MSEAAENVSIEVAPVSADIRIGSVVELENHESYEVESVYEERGNGAELTLELVPSTRRASARLSYGQVVCCYGVIRRICAVRMTTWTKPHVSLKAVGA